MFRPLRSSAKAFSPPKGEKTNSAIIRKAVYAADEAFAYVNKLNRTLLTERPVFYMVLDYLMEPSTMPCTMYFCAKMYRMMIGVIASRVETMIRFHCLTNAPLKP